MELSLPTAVLNTFMGSVILLMALIYIANSPGAPKGLNWWVMGIALSTLRFFVIYWIMMTRQVPAMFFAEVLQVISAFFLVVGSLQFLNRRVHWNILISLSIVVTAWAAYTTFLNPNFLLRTIPLYSLSGVAVIITGLIFIRSRHSGDKLGYSLTGALFILWGMHKIDFPFLRPVEWFAPYGFLIAALLFMSIAISLIIITQRRMLLISQQEIKERKLAEAALKESEYRFQRLFETSEVSIWDEDLSEVYKELETLKNKGITDLRQYYKDNIALAWDLAAKVKVLHVNSATLKLFKAYSEKEFILQIGNTFGPGAIQMFIEELCAIWEKNNYFRREASFLTLDGQQIEAIVSFKIPNKPEGFASIAVSILDITELKLTEVSLQKSENRYRELVNDIPDLLYRVDMEGRILFISPSVYEMTGYTVDDSIGMKMAEKTYAQIEKRESFLTGLKKNHQIKNFEAEFIRKDGSSWWGSTSAHYLKSDDGEIIGIEGLVRDISDKKTAEQQLSYQANHDQLTGLINRHEFERRAERLLSNLLLEHSNNEHALCFLDLDQFKVINDTCGHIAGDELLRQLSRKMNSVVRKRDTLARIGGDEFGLLMEHCSIEKAKRVAETLRLTIQDYEFVWEEKLFRVGVSIGLTAITESSASVSSLLKQADAACFMAKDLGRNRIHIYHTDDAGLALREGEMQWVSRINKAFDKNRFCLFAQPIIPLDSDDKKHYELLIRMKEKNSKTIPPGAFLPAAERYSLITKIDTWVVSSAFLLLSENVDFMSQVDFITINLSGPSLTSDDFQEFLIHEFEKADIDAKKICFEVTETVAISNLNAAISFITKLKGIGCRFALDDFGSGLSSFGYLKNLPVDYLKIDGMFVKDIVDDPIDHAMVKSINDIGHVMGMQTIAEFVENDEIKGMLKAIGVDYVQGYGIGKPQPLEDLISQIDKEVLS